MFFDPHGVVESLVRLVLLRYDPDGVANQRDNQNESASTF